MKLSALKNSRVPSKIALAATLVGCLLLVVAVLVTYSGNGGGNVGGFATLSVQRVNVAYQRGDNARTMMRIDEQFELAEGDGVEVDPGGEGTLQFSDYLRVRLFRDAQLRLSLEAGIAEDAPPIYQLRLSGGSVFSTITPDEIASQRVKLNLETEWAVIEDTGTEFFAYVDPISEVTWVIVKEGSVTVTAAGTAVTVDARFQSWVEPGQPPTDPVPATRQQIGDRFPLIDYLTSGAIRDSELLIPEQVLETSTPLPTAANTATASKRPASPSVTTQSTATSTQRRATPTGASNTPTRPEATPTWTVEPGVTPEIVTVTPEVATVTPEVATVTPEVATVTPEILECPPVPLVRGFGELWTDNEAVRTQMGCPLYAEARFNGGAWQPFENGEMIWLDLGAIDAGCMSGPWILVIYSVDSYYGQRAYTYADTFVDGQLESDPSIVPGPGQFQPTRGFGKVWRNVPDVRDRIGWATEPESGSVAVFQRFENGFMVFLDKFDNQRIWVFDIDSCGASDGPWELHDDTYEL